MLSMLLTALFGLGITRMWCEGNPHTLVDAGDDA